MMNRIKAQIGLFIVGLGIKLYEAQPWGLLDEEDKANLRKLWDHHEGFAKVLRD